jgi:hypothetical protein
VSDQPESSATGQDELPPEPPPDSTPVKFELWRWTLVTTVHECAVELWRDGDHRLTLPLTAGQAELLLGYPHTLASALEGFPGITEGGSAEP